MVVFGVMVFGLFIGFVIGVSVGIEIGRLPQEIRGDREWVTPEALERQSFLGE